MSDFALWPVLAGSAAFFAVGAIWYGMLFGKIWQREVGLSDEEAQSGNPAKIFGLCFLFEMLIAMVLWHLIARTSPEPHVVMMMSVGFAVAVMVPAIGINYLFQRRSGLLFAIDSAHFIVGMAAMGGVFLLFI